MKDSDYRNLLLKRQPLSQWRAIRNTLLQKHNIQQGDFELLMELYQLEYFTTEDFRTAAILLSWDERRWKRLKEDNFIVIYREKRGGSNHRYDIWQLSRRAKMMVREAYDIISGAKPIPREILKKKNNYSSKVLNTRAKLINNGREESRD